MSDPVIEDSGEQSPEDEEVLLGGDPKLPPVPVRLIGENQITGQGWNR